MSPNEEIAGNYVMVHPELKNDPAGKAAQIGTIRHADLIRNDVYVEFQDGQLGLYAANALLTLKKSEDIFKYLERDGHTLSFIDYNNLHKIALIERFGYPEQVSRALELAKESETVYRKGLVSLEDHLGLKNTIRRLR
ncbi:hypothetical protein GCM10023149_37870 [Mucilaginibacter gynuensis]|uniref:Uncharacterized protein n=1 Tax=Mucilaginibacter gynuensis TaxID=1302236 RepID=A0ABP8GZ16_9SPHI